MINITVGPAEQQRTWMLPKALLSHHSEFFRAALEHNFKEGIERKVTLLEDDPRDFEMFVYWLHFQGLPIDFLLVAADRMKVDDAWLGFRLWVLGDKLLAPEFQNLIMHSIYSFHDSGFNLIFPEEVDYCFSNTHPSSPLYRFVMDFTVSQWGSPEYHEVIDLAGWEMVLDEHPELAKGVAIHHGNFGSDNRRKIGPESDYLACGTGGAQKRRLTSKSVIVKLPLPQHLRG